MITMRMRFSFIVLLSLLFFNLLVQNSLIAQVLIGGNTSPSSFSLLELTTQKVKGGLRLPQLSTTERDVLTTNDFKADLKAQGLTIYNTSTRCVEYWNQNKWVSLCKGSAQIDFTDGGGNPVDPTTPPFPPEGGDHGPFIPSENPPCVGQDPFTFTIVSGSSFASVFVLSPSTGEFYVSMTPNHTALPRTAILRITNNCTQEYKELLFLQEGNTSLCNTGVQKPTITASNSGVLCAGGAVYLKVDNPVAGATYIWSMNNVELGRGVFYVAKVKGNYQVFVGGIGCMTNASNKVEVTLSATQAPANPIKLYATNNGVICGASSVQLTILNPSDIGSATLAWYKDGVKTSKTGNTISLSSADVGQWFVVIESGTCTSVPSDIINVIVNSVNIPLTPPVIQINGTAIASVANFCSNGRIELLLANYAVYTTAVTVNWYNGNNYLGAGERLSIKAPASGSFMLRCVVKDNTGTACDAEFIENKTISGNAPATPGIVGTPSICGANPANLTATVSGSGVFSYKWYKNGAVIVGATTQSLLANEVGTYQVEVIEGGCISPLSLPVTVGLSDYPSLSWQVTNAEVELGEQKTFQVLGAFAPTSFTWTVDNGAIIKNGQGTSTASILFPNTETVVTVKVTAQNPCGTSSPLQQVVDVKPACSPLVVNNSSLSPDGESMIEGGTLTMSVSTTGTSPTGVLPEGYQWMLDGAPIAGATSKNYTVNNVKKVHSGTYSCKITNCLGSIVEVVGKMEVLEVATIPIGSGYVGGLTCFDIAQTEYGVCGQLATRKNYRADFTKSYVYTFYNFGTSSNLTFVIEDTEQAVESYAVQANLPATLVDKGTYTLAVKYKESLMADAIGRSSLDPIYVTIHAFYKVGADTKKFSLRIDIKDCSCCGAFVAPGEWKDFDCFNLGADRTKDPLVPSRDINGEYYQWGRKAKVANSPANGDNVIGTWNSIAVSVAKIWNSGTEIAPKKTTDDPCPTGYRIPTKRELDGLIANNLVTKFGGSGWAAGTLPGGFNHGTLFGSGLFFPATGFRNAGNGMQYSRGVVAYYWSSYQENTTEKMALSLNYLGPGSGKIKGETGASVRCIAE